MSKRVGALSAGLTVMMLAGAAAIAADLSRQRRRCRLKSPLPERVGRTERGNGPDDLHAEDGGFVRRVITSPEAMQSTQSNEIVSAHRRG